MKRFSIILLCILFSVVWLSCGYTTRTTLTTGHRTIHIEPFANKVIYATEQRRNIYLPLLEVDVRNAIVDRFLLDGNLRIVEPEKADLILKGELTRYERSPLRYTDSDVILEYRVHITVRLELWDTNKRDMEWVENGFVGEATYFVSGSEATTEESAVAEAITDLARRIIERTIENW